MAKGKAEKEKNAGKTNVMRLLDAAKIPYEAKTYPVDEADLSGSHAADLMGVDHGSMFKTLVLKGERTGYLVCCIPVDDEVDLKKAAKARQKSRDASHEGAFAGDWIYSGRLLAGGDEKEVSHLDR